MGPPVVSTRHLEKTYVTGDVSVHALREVDIDLSKGEFVVVMGPSGSGKTTLLNLLGALDRPSGGNILIDGEDLNQLKEEELTRLRRERVGFVFQFYNLIPTLTALENVELPMLMAGVSRRERESRARALLAMVGLAERANHLPDELSGGEQQRVTIARALANRPSIILADEPTGDLDTKTGTEVVRMLRDLARKEGVTVVAVTHDPVVAEMADRILEMRDGRIVGERRLSI